MDNKINGRLFKEEMNVIYDSKCGVCKMEIDFLRRRDEKLASLNNAHPRLKFTDLEGEGGGDYNPMDKSNGGITYAQGMASIHAVTFDGKILNGVPVFRALYQEVGLGWLFAVTKYPILKQLSNLGYDLFAKYRTNITRGQKLESLIKMYEEKKKIESKQKRSEKCDTATMTCRT
uniref:DUF393 domain-containing protein n=1 Tax=Ditylum brightwellii TaxID=49249 RepID=A0A7S4VTY4_9STRA